MGMYVQTLGFHDLTSPPSLQVISGPCRVLFNTGENSQRLRMEKNLHMNKIHSIFFTDLSISSITGLPGLLMAIDNLEVDPIEIIGPVGICTIIESLSSTFMNLQYLKIKVIELKTIERINITKELQIICIPLIKSNVKRFKPSTYRIAYIINCSQRSGILDIDKALNLGIPKGPLLGQLKSGKTITLKDGTVIEPNQVVGKPIIGSQALILKIENEHDLQLAKSIIPQYSDKDRLHFTFHLKINDNYDEFKDSLHIDVDQSSDLPKFALFSWAEMANLTLKTMYNTQVYKSTETSNNNNHDNNNQFPPLTIFHMYDKSKLKTQTRNDRIDMSNCLNYKSQLKPFPINDLIPNFNYTNGKYKLIMLGTGGCAPSPSRNVSSILIVLDEYSSILLDCGEGTLYQLYLSSTSWDNFIYMLKSIRAIVITHSHADHHMGIAAFVAYRNQVLTNADPISVISPPKVKKWLNQILCNSINIPCNLMDHSSVTINPFKITLFEVLHIVDSVGVIVEVSNAFKIVYSGDTRPCDSTVNAAMNCDILIHEATFYHSDLNHAIEKRHTTVKEAVEIAEKANCKLLVLTHFSQRYSLPIDIKVDCKFPKDRIIAALDHLVIHF